MAHLESAGVTLKQLKCAFLVKSMEYLGHVINQHVLHPSQEKIYAIQNAPKPKILSKLKLFLGILNYYGNFTPKL